MGSDRPRSLPVCQLTRLSQVIGARNVYATGRTSGSVVLGGVALVRTEKIAVGYPLLYSVSTAVLSHDGEWPLRSPATKQFVCWDVASDNGFFASCFPVRRDVSIGERKPLPLRCPNFKWVV